jgi:hypothetical protein
MLDLPAFANPAIGSRWRRGPPVKIAHHLAQMRFFSGVRLAFGCDLLFLSF